MSPPRFLFGQLYVITHRWKQRQLPSMEARSWPKSRTSDVAGLLAARALLLAFDRGRCSDDDVSDMSTPVTRGELREELEQRLAPLATKAELEIWGGALLARIESSEQRQIERIDRTEQRLHVELARHAKALHESMVTRISASDEKSKGLPERVSRLETAVFGPGRVTRGPGGGAMDRGNRDDPCVSRRRYGAAASAPRRSRRGRPPPLPSALRRARSSSGLTNWPV